MKKKRTMYVKVLYKAERTIEVDAETRKEAKQIAREKAVKKGIPKCDWALCNEKTTKVYLNLYDVINKDPYRHL